MVKKFPWGCLAMAAACLTAEAEDNILMPLVQLSITPPPMDDYGAFSFLGELGDRNYRGSGTYGVYFTPCQRFKISGEYLTQRLEYKFIERHKKEWVAQYAIGSAYQYLLPKSPFESIDAGASYSHAFNEDISDLRFIAGSDGGYGYLGTTVRLWKCGYLSPAVNYDYVKYHCKFHDGRIVKGWGGTVNYVQLLPRDLTLNLDAEFRQPFYFYESSINWSQRYDDWGASFGVYANYTDGRHGVPHVVAGGFQIGFFFGGTTKKCCRVMTEPPSTETASAKKPPEKEGAKPWFQDCYSTMYCDVMNWVQAPAIYMPVVLARREQKYTECSAPPAHRGKNSYVEIFSNSFVRYDVNELYFSTAPMTFTGEGFDEIGLSLNPETGIVSGFVPFTATETHYTAKVTATSTCGAGKTITVHITVKPPKPADAPGMLGVGFGG